VLSSGTVLSCRVRSKSDRDEFAIWISEVDDLNALRQEHVVALCNQSKLDELEVIATQSGNVGDADNAVGASPQSLEDPVVAAAKTWF
jgi:hypothetical protein